MWQSQSQCQCQCQCPRHHVLQSPPLLRRLRLVLLLPPLLVLQPLPLLQQQLMLPILHLARHPSHWLLVQHLLLVLLVLCHAHAHAHLQLSQ